MMDVSSPIPEDADISCPFQKDGMGTQLCSCAVTNANGVTNETNERICFACEAGRIYREVGCDAFTAKVRIYSLPLNHFTVERIFCTKKKRATTLEQCRKCTLVTAPTTKEIISNTVGLFQSENFYSAYQDIEGARKRLRDGDYDGAITQSISFLESVMKTVLDRCGTSHPNDPSVTKLWGSVKKELNFDEYEGADKIISLLGTLSGAVSHLGGVRNYLGDAHGNGEDAPEVPFMFAELAINTSSTLATVIVRRFNQIKER